VQTETTSNNNTTINNPRIISGTRKNWIMFRMWMSVSIFVIRKYKTPIKFIKIVRRVKELKDRYNFENGYKKVAYVDGRTFISPNNNGWPAKHFNRLIDIEARTALNDNVSNLEQLNIVLIALTKKCPLNCEHCYEAEELNKRDTLTLEDHKKILKKVQDAGIPMIQYGGGDPMAKVNDLVELLEFAQKTSDFWISTSGFNFTSENAIRLKTAGLTGISISLDHHDPDKHNKFRRNDKAFQWAIDAAKNAREAGLVINLSPCITKEFITKENLQRYLEFAGEIGASFVQMIEPRAVGNYAMQNVHLQNEHIEIAERFFLDANEDPKYRHLPIVLYPGYHQRKTGCPGAGAKYLYIDTDGYMSSCPFCRNKKTHILDEDERESSIHEMRNEGCGAFENLN
jgi:MoaA/NifB/PqqE/SkfB family radical SAM enzyme